MLSIAVKTIATFAVFAGNANAAVTLAAASPAATQINPKDAAAVAHENHERAIRDYFEAYEYAVDAYTIKVTPNTSPQQLTVTRNDFSKLFGFINPAHPGANKVVLDLLIQQQNAKFMTDLEPLDEEYATAGEKNKDGTTNKKLAHGTAVWLRFEDGSASVATWSTRSVIHSGHWKYAYYTKGNTHDFEPTRVNRMPKNLQKEMTAIRDPVGNKFARTSLCLVLQRLTILKEALDTPTE